MEIACLDLEGVLVPEIWIDFAERTGVNELRATTRDIPDYDVLMKQRLRLLRENNLGIRDIQSVVILSDTFYEFSEPLMRQLKFPTLFCHRLIVDSHGNITDYKLRQKDPKRQCVKAFHSLNYRVIASGDSYNDTTMLSEAEAGILFRAPKNVIEEFPQYPSVTSYDELRREFIKASDRELAL